MSINITSNSSIEPDIIDCLNRLYSTPAGTVALDRDFGIDYSFLDLPMPQAKAKYTKEIVLKTKKYEPRVTVSAVTFSYDELNGTLKARVKIDAVN